MDRTEPLPTISYQPVGVVRSPFTELTGMPLQSVAAGEIGDRWRSARGSRRASRISTASLACTSSPICTVARQEGSRVPEFDSVTAERTGWLKSAGARVHEVRADARFDER
jgi:hypothetical protein